LLLHPAYALAAPLHGRQKALYSTPGNASSLVDPAVGSYDDNPGHRFLPLPRVLERVLFPRGIAVVCGLLAAVLAGAAAVARFRGPSLVWVVPVAVLLTTYLHWLVV